MKRKPMPYRSWAELEERAVYYEKLAKTCEYCGGEFSSGMHRDHIVPRVSGGVDTPDNIAWACRNCNLSKGCKLGWVTLDGRRGRSIFSDADGIIWYRRGL
jgi:5-methylcytosine-specific restriction endonuclease McrA